MKTRDRRQQAIPIDYLLLSGEAQKAIEQAYEANQHLYFIYAPAHNMVKIGVAGSPSHRLRTLQSGSPTTLELLFVIPFGGYMLESLLHKRFKDSRHKGEWFEYTDAISEFIGEAKAITSEVGLIWDLKTQQVEHA